MGPPGAMRQESRRVRTERVRSLPVQLSFSHCNPPKDPSVAQHGCDGSLCCLLRCGALRPRHRCSQHLQGMASELDARRGSRWCQPLLAGHNHVPALPAGGLSRAFCRAHRFIERVQLRQRLQAEREGCACGCPPRRRCCPGQGAPAPLIDRLGGRAATNGGGIASVPGSLDG